MTRADWRERGKRAPRRRTARRASSVTRYRGGYIGAPLTPDVAALPLYVRFGLMRDLVSVERIARRAMPALGFVRRLMLVDAVHSDHLFVAERGSLVVGFARTHFRRDGRVTIHDIAMREDQQRCGGGRLLVAAVAYEGRRRGMVELYAQTAAELPANAFWRGLAFGRVGVEDGKKRVLVQWRAWLEDLVSDDLRE